MLVICVVLLTLFSCCRSFFFFAIWFLCWNDFILVVVAILSTSSSINQRNPNLFINQLTYHLALSYLGGYTNMVICLPHPKPSSKPIVKSKDLLICRRSPKAIRSNNLARNHLKINSNKRYTSEVWGWSMIMGRTCALPDVAEVLLDERRLAHPETPAKWVFSDLFNRQLKVWYIKTHKRNHEITRPKTNYTYRLLHESTSGIDW